MEKSKRREGQHTRLPEISNKVLKHTYRQQTRLPEISNKILISKILKHIDMVTAAVLTTGEFLQNGGNVELPELVTLHIQKVRFILFD